MFCSGHYFPVSGLWVAGSLGKAPLSVNDYFGPNALIFGQDSRVFQISLMGEVGVMRSRG